MAIAQMQVVGYRGFAAPAKIAFAVPNGATGSGLTVVTGPNNAGKSSIVECLQMRSPEGASFDIGTRNASVDKVELQFEINGQTEILSSIVPGSSEASIDRFDQKQTIFIVPSRRSFAPYFGKAYWSREEYQRPGRTPPRSPQLNGFEYRLFNIQGNPTRFNELLEQALGYLPQWAIDRDRAQYFLKFYNGKLTHSSEGVGEGIISIFAILDALHDSADGDAIAIDEPELSLHPALQRRLFDILARYAATRQIILATHSPYSIDPAWILNGGQLARVARRDGMSRIYQLSAEGMASFKKLASSNLNNPHVLGLNARELFFQEDQLVVTEGQEDVVLYPKVAAQAGVKLAGSFYGWGSGGADNVVHVCRVLRDLGFQRVVGLLDKGKEKAMKKLVELFPTYCFKCIPAEDIRTKPSRAATSAVIGLLDENLALRQEFLTSTGELLKEVNSYLTPASDGLPVA